MTDDKGIDVRRWLIAASATAVLATGCAPGTDGPPTTGPSAAATTAVLLAEYGLAGKDTVQIIDHLDRLDLAQRPAADLKASVRPSELLLTRGAQQVSLAIPGDRFYLSVAPYVSRTHECFHHSLTTCKGELAARDVQVTVLDETNDRVLVDGARTTFANGFVGFWLPRDIDGTVRIADGGKTGELRFTTGEQAPTCLTTLRLT